MKPELQRAVRGLQESASKLNSVEIDGITQTLLVMHIDKRLIEMSEELTRLGSLLAMEEGA